MCFSLDLKYSYIFPVWLMPNSTSSMGTAKLWLRLPPACCFAFGKVFVTPYLPLHHTLLWETKASRQRAHHHSPSLFNSETGNSCGNCDTSWLKLIQFAEKPGKTNCNMLPRVKCFWEWHNRIRRRQKSSASCNFIFIQFHQFTTDTTLPRSRCTIVTYSELYYITDFASAVTCALQMKHRMMGWRKFTRSSFNQCYLHHL